MKATKPEPPVPGQLLRKRDAARVLQVSERTVEHLIAAGKLATVPVGLGLRKPRRRITRESLEKFVRKHESTR